ncbi:MAG: hypothetical protein DMG03_29310 [Acidobacteria bacterium]|nr:MAG: hypothetical protein DMG03_29310 [Acidobacteriota bacterium]
MEERGHQAGVPRGAEAARRWCQRRRIRREELDVQTEPRIPNPESRIPSSESQWFAIWTRSRHEQVVREQLERKHFEAFLPTITKWSRWKDRKKKIDWPLFPGYCFARFNPRERLPILKCTGVVSIISFEGEPAPIPEHEIEGIRALIESELAYEWWRWPTARCAASSDA